LNPKGAGEIFPTALKKTEIFVKLCGNYGMRICQGTKRTAIITDRFTVKVARVNVRGTLRDAVSSMRRGWDLAGFQYSLSSVRDSLAMSLTGISENWTEGQNSKKLGDLVVPTFMSLGVVNLQATAQDHGLSRQEIFPVLNNRVGCANGIHILTIDSHTFHPDDNYGIHQGKLKILDYGSKKAVKIMMENGERLRQGLADVFSTFHLFKR